MRDHEPTARHDRDRGHPEAEAAVRAALAAGDLPRALATTIAAYGAEVYGFLRAVTKRGQDARRVYGAFIERLPHHLHGVAADCELRVLVYAVARREVRRDRGRPEHVAMRATVAAPAHLRPPRVVSLRLAPDDLELVVLRLDRGFSWRQLAHTSFDAPAAESALCAEADRLRARFLVVRRALAHLAQEHTA